MSYTETATYFRDGYAFGTLGADTTVRFDDSSDPGQRKARMWISDTVNCMTDEMTVEQVAGLRDALDAWLQVAERSR